MRSKRRKERARVLKTESKPCDIKAHRRLLHPTKSGAPSRREPQINCLPPRGKVLSVGETDEGYTQKDNEKRPSSVILTVARIPPVSLRLGHRTALKAV